jgi:hypothetical protein
MAQRNAYSNKKENKQKCNAEGYSITPHSKQPDEQHPSKKVPFQYNAPYSNSSI